MREGDRVLDVGAGSGWSTALLAHLTGPTGEVLGVELEPTLVEFGRANLARVDRPWARIEQADPERLGWPDDGAVRPGARVRRATQRCPTSSSSS